MRYIQYEFIRCIAFIICRRCIVLTLHVPDANVLAASPVLLSQLSNIYRAAFFPISSWRQVSFVNTDAVMLLLQLAHPLFVSSPKEVKFLSLLVCLLAG